MTRGSAVLLRRRTLVTEPPPPPPPGTFPTPVAWGDSLTNQKGYTDAIDDRLSAYYGISVTTKREGVGSQRSEGIAARQGGRPALVNAVTIPANGSTTITFTNNVDFLNTYDAIPIPLPCTLGGIPGEITKAGTGTNVDCWAFKFNRTGSGAATAIAAGTPVLLQKSIDLRNHGHIMRPGHNNRNPRPCTGGPDNLASTVDGPITHLAAMWNWATSVGSKAIVVGLITADPNFLGPNFASLSADATFVNSNWASTYGANYCNLRSYLSSKQALVDAGIISNDQPVPAQDQDAIDRLYPPRSFQEGIHLNPDGQRVSGLFVANFIIARNWAG